MAGHVATIIDLAQGWLFDFAPIHGDGTPRVESAAGRRIDGRGHVASENDALLFCGGVRNRDSTE